MSFFTRSIVAKTLSCCALLAVGILLSGLGLTVSCGPVLSTALLLSGFALLFGAFAWFIVILVQARE